MHKNFIITCTLALSMILGLTLSACTPHRIDIQQGNKVEPKDFAKIKTGMSRKQVVFILGTPLLQDPFHSDRWDYIYYLKPGNDPIKQSRVTFYFTADTLSRIDSSEYHPGMHSDTSICAPDCNTEPTQQLESQPQHAH